MLSRKTKYGLHALFYLAENYGKGPLLIAEIAQRQALPKKFLEAILLELNKKGVLESRKGKGGGYNLKRSPEHITMGEVVRILEGPLAPVRCVSQTAYGRCGECLDEQMCGIRLVMKEVRDSMANILDKRSLADVLRQIQQEQNILNYTI